VSLRWSLGFLFGLMLGAHVAAQTGGATDIGDTTGKSVPDTESQVVEENQYFRVSRVQLAAGITTRIDQHGRDIVVLALGEGLALLAPKAAESIILKDGEAQFLSRGIGPRVANSANSTVPLLVVELKQHWDAEVRVCSDSVKCTRSIRMGEFSIGETTSLFTNGFVTGYQHRLDRGGTLNSSYFSARGKDHILIIALTDLQVNLDGSDQALRAGQTYGTEATAVEVNAVSAPARWVVIRVETSKT
jgi:quercetin dioxygenase-like cupin family protein